jgi:hypothetical protein
MTRSLRTASSLFGLDTHPAMLSLGKAAGSPSRLHPVLTAVLYSCSLESMYRAMHKQAGMDQKLKRKHASVEAKVQGKAKQALSWNAVQTTAMQDHLVRTLDQQHVYSCRRGVLQAAMRTDLSHRLPPMLFQCMVVYLSWAQS